MNKGQKVTDKLMLDKSLSLRGTLAVPHVKVRDKLSNLIKEARNKLRNLLKSLEYDP